MSKVSEQIVLFKEKTNGRIFPMGCIPKTGFFNSDEYEKNYTIINLNDIDKKQDLLNSSYDLTRWKSLTKTQYDLLTIACSTEEIHTRKLSREECEVIIHDTHRFIHDILEINEFTITDDDGKNPRPFKWSEHGKIFIDQNLKKND